MKMMAYFSDPSLGPDIEVCGFDCYSLDLLFQAGTQILKGQSWQGSFDFFMFLLVFHRHRKWCRRSTWTASIISALESGVCIKHYLIS